MLSHDLGRRLAITSRKRTLRLFELVRELLQAGLLHGTVGLGLVQPPCCRLELEDA